MHELPLPTLPLAELRGGLSVRRALASWLGGVARALRQRPRADRDR
ncbi:MAG TPA: hypothetical protein PL196_02795 [Burkholderiaceae bacterium]|nr:hypothetical protein [Burkholderiaceae bacterium]